MCYFLARINRGNDYHSGKNDLDILYHFVTSTKAPYITFTPSILSCPHEDLIQYQIGYTMDEPDSLQVVFTTTPIPNLSQTNPTPPRNSY